MKIAFGAALPVGVGGLRECFDLQMTRYIAPEKAAAALMAASVPDLMVTSCESIGSKDPAASVAYPISTYRVVLSEAPQTIEVPAEITVIRKKKEKTIVPAEFIVGEIEANKNILEFTLEAKPTGSLRPDVLVRHLTAAEPAVFPLSITRTEQRVV
ncbi:MAG: TIGR03936 family radical SAM-associated protein, partial [Raoultibacter sp.]